MKGDGKFDRSGLSGAAASALPHMAGCKPGDAKSIGAYLDDLFGKAAWAARHHLSLGSPDEEIRERARGGIDPPPLRSLDDPEGRAEVLDAVANQAVGMILARRDAIAAELEAADRQAELDAAREKEDRVRRRFARAILN